MNAKKLVQISALALATLMPLPALSAELAGNYLAARLARLTNDYDAAVHYYMRALGNAPREPRLLDGLIMAQVSAGAVDSAVSAARRLEELGIDSQVAHMALLADELTREDFTAVQTRLAENRGIGPLVDGLLSAWVLLGQGDMSAALARFDAVGEEPGLARFARYHKALALAYVGDFEGAEALYVADGDRPVQMTRRAILSRAEALSQLDRNTEALTLIDNVFGSDPGIEVQQLRARLAAGETLPYTHVRSVRDGVAEVFYSVAAALEQEASEAYTLLYARMATALRPDHVDAILLTGELLEDLDRPELATRAYRKVPREDAAFYLAELGRAAALRKAGRPDAALEVLDQLAEVYPTLPKVQASRGDHYRWQGKHLEAVQAYDAALDLYSGDDPSKWFVYYARGMSQERLGNWPEAKADFRAALEINPDQPNLLNYFGYSMVEKREDLDEALAMIEKAVSIDQGSGYIVDSLGWALFQLDRFDESVVHMERAAALMPVDPVVNDHLGDAYWMVGRHREAQFQWTRALSFDPEEAEAARIRRKLQVGLDAVLADERKSTEQVARDGG
ncbi:MAG: tetratricopeptide repeat protein [Rhodobacteraceae bacterium]|nr:tetratricopeptide repeat protein [Paracoccaceae bacterium]MBR9820005.1 tetratricopeptide repeat protein [Paracoccaceae bacterium]